MSAERWRRVPGWPDYAVSNLGQVKSFKGASTRILGGSVIDGYRVVALHAPGRRQFRSVHSLVAEAFIGPRPKGLDIRHLDGDRLNCSVGNLRYGTRAENVQDCIAHGSHYQASKTRCPYGHPYDDVNTYWWKGGRVCRTCKNQRQADYRTRQAQRAAGIRTAA